MALISEELVNDGNWLFRWRSYLPVLVFGLFLLFSGRYSLEPDNETLQGNFWTLICIVVSFSGLGIRMLTIGCTPRRTSGRNTKNQIADSLNTTGIYSVVRNPLYLGNYIIGLGIALFSKDVFLIVIYSLVFWLYYERIIFAEEEYLKKKFGKKYMDWVNRTPVFIPRFENYQPARLPFSLRNVLKREYSGFLTIILTMFIFKNVEEFYASGSVHTDKWWLLFLCVGITIWFILRSLKKYTPILNVEGR